jgi:ATP-binding cassette subfamily B protein
MNSIFISIVENVKKNFKLIKEYLSEYLLVIFINALLIAINVINPKEIGKLTNSIITKNGEALYISILIVAMLTLIDILISFFKSKILSNIFYSIIKNINDTLFNKVLGLNIKYFDELDIGEFLARFGKDTQNIATFFAHSFIEIIVDFMKVLIIGYLVSKINIYLLISAIFLLPITNIITKLYSKKIREYNINLSIEQERYYNFLYENVSGIREIRSLNLVHESIKKHWELTKKIKKMNIDISRTYQKNEGISKIINSLNSMITIGVGGCLVYFSVITISQFITYVAYVAILSQSLRNLFRFFINYQEIIVSFERVEQIMKLKEADATISKCINNLKLDGAIEFKNVEFSYLNNNNVLKNISFYIEPKGKVALVGKSGEGKSTIFNLLLKLYSPQKGKIRINNININDINGFQVRNNITVISQRPFLFNMSIKENFKIIKPNVTMEEIEEVCRKAYAHEFIDKLPNRYNTIIGRNGNNLSLGQVQRLSIARGLLRNTPIILFDEATSSLDNESQSYIKKAIDDLAVDKTVIIIAHRLSTIKDADNILVLNDGDIIAHGNHAELFRENFFYRELYRTEFNISK